MANRPSWRLAILSLLFMLGTYATKAITSEKRRAQEATAALFVGKDNTTAA
jgi:hypothetical protein